MTLDKLPINGFDLVVIVVVLVSIARGRKVGMSGELVSLVTWLVILFGCAFAYEPLGQLFAQNTGLFGALGSYLTAYTIAGMIIFLIFLMVKRAVSGSLASSDAFGRTEYYLGMLSSVTRSLCIVLVALAILNARFYSTQEIKAEEKFQNDVYGSTFFPTLHSLQATVFEKSLSGSFVKNNLSFLLIKPTSPTSSEYHQREVSFQ